MSVGERRQRVLLAKPGLDGHDRGILLVARALRDAAFEVIYLGLRVRPEEVVQSALQEDVDLIGLSVFSGGHMTLVPRILSALQANGIGAVPVVVGGTVPPKDAARLKSMGVREVFGPGCSPAEILASIRCLISAQGSPGQPGADPGTPGTESRAGRSSPWLSRKSEDLTP